MKGCDSLSPLAHGRNIFFSGCRKREIITKEFDLKPSR